MTSLTPELDLARTIALPSRLGEAFGREIWGHEWVAHPFILDAEREIVAACLREDTQDWFIMNCPNQVGKTSWAGILLIFWYIGMFPDKQVIFISYSDIYSSEYGRRVRDLFKLYGKTLFGLEVDTGNDSNGDWTLKGHPSGGMLSVGIGGQITGRQGHLVVIDDVLRNMRQAASDADKEAHWSDWKGTIWGRRQPGCVYVVTATRLVDDDLTGRLLEEQRHDGGIDWQHLIYPGICEPPEDYDGDPDDYVDRLGRRVGEPLVTRFTLPTHTVEDNWWTQARKGLNNDLLFDCMIQQRPSRSTGGMFPETKWRFVPRAEWPQRYVKARGWDLATTKDGGDYTVGSLVGRGVDGDIYIEGRLREQLDTDSAINQLKALAQTDGPSVAVVIEEEKGGSGKFNIEFYRRLLPGYMVEGSPVSGTKEMRATPYSILQQGGHVVLPSDPDDEEWVKGWVKEHSKMMGDGRRPKHDDQIDTAAHAVNYLIEHGLVEIRDPNDLSVADIEMQLYLEAMGVG